PTSGSTPFDNTSFLASIAIAGLRSHRARDPSRVRCAPPRAQTYATFRALSVNCPCCQRVTSLGSRPLRFCICWRTIRGIVPGRPILPGGLVDGAMRTLVLGTPPPNQPLLVTPLGRPAEAVAVYERRLAGIEREVGGTNGRLEVTNIRLGHLEELAEQLVDLVGNGFRDLREDNRMIRA